MPLYTTGGASILSPDQVAALVVRPLIESSVAARASTVINTTSHSLRVPIVSADPTAQFVPEGGEIPATDPTLTELKVTPSKLAGLTVISSELAADSSPAALGVVGDGLVRDVRRQVDAAWLSVSTPNGPAGLPSLASSTASAGGSWDDFDWAEAAKSAAEVLHTEITSFIASPSTALALSTVKQFGTAGSNVPLLAPDPTAPASRTIAGVPLLVSPSCAADTVWAVPRAHALFVIRQDVNVTTDASAYFSSDRLGVRCTMRVGFGLPAGRCCQGHKSLGAQGQW